MHWSSHSVGYGIWYHASVFSQNDFTFLLAQLQILVDCSGDDNEEKNPETAFSNKKTTLLKIIEESPVRKTIVFCNKVSPFPNTPCAHWWQADREITLPPDDFISLLDWDM